MAAMDPNGSSSSSARPFKPLFMNPLGATLMEENLRILSDFIFMHASANPDVEIEGKLGLLFDKKKALAKESARIHIDGVRSLVCIDTDEIDANFAAEVDGNMFKHLNENLLQRRYEDDQEKARKANSKPFWSLTHKKLTDRFYTVGEDRVRVTVDDATSTVLQSIVKDKLQHLDFYYGRPGCIDFRVSANRERKVPVPTSACDQVRKKERISYKFDLFAIELTRVDLYNHVTPQGEPVAGARADSTTFEVEVEISQMAYINSEIIKCKNGQANDVTKIAQSLMDTMRSLAQFSMPGSFPSNWKHSAAALQAQAQQQAAAQQAAQHASNRKRAREAEEVVSAKDAEPRAWSQ